MLLVEASLINKLSINTGPYREEKRNYPRDTKLIEAYPSIHFTSSQCSNITVKKIAIYK